MLTEDALLTLLHSSCASIPDNEDSALDAERTVQKAIRQNTYAQFMMMGAIVNALSRHLAASRLQEFSSGGLLALCSCIDLVLFSSAHDDAARSLSLSADQHNFSMSTERFCQQVTPLLFAEFIRCALALDNTARFCIIRAC